MDRLAVDRPAAQQLCGTSRKANDLNEAARRRPSRRNEGSEPAAPLETELVATGRRPPTSRHKFNFLWASAVVVTAVVLRPAATSIGPLLAEVKADLGMSDTVAGFLTPLPGLCFALVGLTANRLAPKFGLVGSLAQAALLITAGSVVRVLTGSWELFLVFSFVALAGMAIGNVLLPAFIKVAFPQRSTAMATVYTTFLAVGAILPTMLARPLERVGAARLGEVTGWRAAVGVWALLGFASLVLWLLVRARTVLPGAATSYGSGPRFRTRRLWGSPTAVALMLFFGVQSMQAYIQFGWLAQMYRDGGLPSGSAALMLTIVAAGGVPGGLLMPRIVAGRRFLAPTIVVLSALLAAGWLGIAFAPTTTPWLWALFLSISGFAFSGALAMIIGRTSSPTVTGGVSAFVQPIGYFLAALGPFLVGFAYELIGDWKPILFVLAGTSLIMGAAGVIAARPRPIDREIGYLETDG